MVGEGLFRYAERQSYNLVNNCRNKKQKKGTQRFSYNNEMLFDLGCGHEEETKSWEQSILVR